MITKEFLLFNANDGGFNSKKEVASQSDFMIDKDFIYISVGSINNYDNTIDYAYDLENNTVIDVSEIKKEALLKNEKTSIINSVSELYNSRDFKSFICSIDGGSNKFTVENIFETRGALFLVAESDSVKNNKKWRYRTSTGEALEMGEAEAKMYVSLLEASVDVLYQGNGDVVKKISDAATIDEVHAIDWSAEMWAVKRAVVSASPYFF